MKRYGELSAEEIQAYLSRGWLTHDGMWLFNVYNSLGAEKGNELNKAAIRSMAPIEMKRTRDLLGYDSLPADIGGLERFMQDALAILLPPELRDSLSFSVSGRFSVRWRWRKEACFAYRGMKRINMLDHYQCGVIYRIECWLETLGYGHELVPTIDGCLMKNDGMCGGEIVVDFRGRKT